MREEQIRITCPTYGLNCVIRYVDIGQRYGRDMSLENSGPKPYVEFYDADYPL